MAVNLTSTIVKLPESNSSHIQPFTMIFSHCISGEASPTFGHANANFAVLLQILQFLRK